MKNEINRTAHSTYRCEYHIVFAPKYRRQIVYGQIKKDIGEIFRKLCNEKKVEIIEAEACPNHIHMLVSIPPYLSIAQFVGFLKSKSTLLSFSQFETHCFVTPRDFASSIWFIPRAVRKVLILSLSIIYLISQYIKYYFTNLIDKLKILLYIYY